jgi:uncharacterized protein
VRAANGDIFRQGGVRMMKISTRGRYGVRAICDLAFHGAGEPEQIRKIAERQEIPPRYLEQIFQRLKRAGILKTQRGAKGGYYLGRHPSEITVADVVQVTDGPLVPVICRDYKEKDAPCHRAEACVVKSVWDEVGRRLKEYLGSVTIADLCDRAAAGQADLNSEWGTVMDPVAVRKLLLREILREMGSALLAFSGGVDSALLLNVARGALTENLLAVTFQSALNPPLEVEEAVSEANRLGVPHRLMKFEPLSDSLFAANRSDRCYRCKRAVMSRLVDLAKAQGYSWVVEGSHAGDLGIRSPLREAGIDKDEIRLWARELEIPHWDRPPMACLATRIPTGRRITLGKLHRVAQAEDCLRRMGFRQFRARHHGRAVRVQVGQEEVGRILEEGLRRRMIREMTSAGFREVWIDLRGYGALQ